MVEHAPGRPGLTKLRVAGAGIIDLVVDLLLPTLVVVALAPTGLSASVRLTVGGFLLAAKAAGGHLGVGAGEHPGPRLRGFVLPLSFATGCAAVTVGIVAGGGSDGLGIGVGTALLAVGTAVHLLRGTRRLDGFAILVLVELAASIALTSISDDPRFVLIRPSIYSVIAGIYILTTVRSPRPFMMQVSAPMAASGDPVRAAAFERAGRESRSFRRTEQAMTVGLGVVLFAEAALRVLTVYSRPADDVVASSLWSQVPAIGLIALYAAFLVLVAVPRASREVDALMPDPAVPNDTTQGATR